MEWNILVSDGDPWVMYRVYIAGLVYIYVQDTWRVLCFSYIASSLSYIVSFGIQCMEGSLVHHLFTYPVAIVLGVFVSECVRQKPSKYPLLHIMSTLPWVISGFYGPLGYPIFLLPYVTTLLIAKMYDWAIVSGVGMVLNGALFPLHSPLVSLIIPIVVLFAYSWFRDIYHDTPYNLDV